METIYKSEDGNSFNSRRSCKLYEESLEEMEQLEIHNINLQFEVVGNYKYYKVNSYAELWYFDNYITHTDGTGSSLYELFDNLKDKQVRFPLWFRNDAKETKMSMVEKKEKEIKCLKQKISDYRDEIKQLKTLDSRTKTPIIEELKQENNNDEEQQSEFKKEVEE